MAFLGPRSGQQESSRTVVAEPEGVEQVSVGFRGNGLATVTHRLHEEVTSARC